MYITKARKYHKDTDGKYVAYDYYRLTRKRYDQCGKGKVEHFCLGRLDGLTKRDRDELADMLTVMIEQGERAMSFTPRLYELAMDFYVQYRESHPAEDYDPVLRAEAERKERERRRDLVTVSIKSLVQKEARTIGPEAICRSTANALKIAPTIPPALAKPSKITAAYSMPSANFRRAAESFSDSNISSLMSASESMS